MPRPLSPEDECSIWRVMSALDGLSTRLVHIERRLNDTERGVKLQEARKGLELCIKILAEAGSGMCRKCQGHNPPEEV